FPFEVVATPSGGRITTEHRCTCRTMGERPPVTPEMLGDLVEASSEVHAPICIDSTRSVDFATYEALEATLLGRLASGEAVEACLDVPALDGAPRAIFEEAAARLQGVMGKTRAAHAMGWAGDGLRW